jgi:hypothetical protein
MTRQPSLRLLATAAFIDTTGTGLFLASAMVFFSRSVGLPASQVALGLSVAGAVGLLAILPMGSLATSRGPQPVLVGLHAVRGLSFLAYAAVDSFPTFLFVVSVITAADRAAPAITQAVVADVAAADDRVRWLAVLRSVRHAGLGIGALAATIPLSLDHRGAYLAVTSLDGLSFLVVAGLVARLPRLEATRRRPRLASPSRLVALRDGGYMLQSVLHAVLALHISVVTVGIPLWVLQHTRAPPAILGPLLFVNTAVIVLCQIPVSRWAGSVAAAGRLTRVAGAVVAVSCVVFSLADRAGSPVLASVVVVVGGIVLALGETGLAAGRWSLSLGLAPEDRRPDYLAAFNLGLAAEQVVGPGLVTFAALRLGLIGWLGLALVFLLSGLAVRVAADRTLLRQKEDGGTTSIGVA